MCCIPFSLQCSQKMYYEMPDTICINDKRVCTESRITKVEVRDNINKLDVFKLGVLDVVHPKVLKEFLKSFKNHWLLFLRNHERQVRF